MFTEAYILFFKELAQNNHSDWFNTNKKRYEKEVKKPFEAFVQQIIAEIHELTPEIMIEPKDAIFRINKDVRFSADKSPYKTEMSAVISKMGKKANPCPGLYINLGPEKIVVASGLKNLEKQELYEVRQHIAYNGEALAEITENQSFKKAFGAIQGDKIKRLPEDLKEAAATQALLYNTSFLAMTEMPAEAMTQADFADKVMALYQASLPFAMFFKEALDA